MTKINSRRYINMNLTGENLRKLMKEHDISVKELGDTLGCTVQAVHKWLKGKSLPSVDNLVILSDIFTLSVDQLIVCDVFPEFVA